MMIGKCLTWLRLALAVWVPGVAWVAMQPGVACGAQEAPAKAEISEYTEVDSAARMDMLFREAAKNLQQDLKIRLSGGWARTARDVFRRTDWYNWVAGYSYSEKEVEGVRCIKISLGFKDSTKMLAAANNPALLEHLNSSERRALQVVEKTLPKIIRPGMKDMDKIQAVHDWIINRTTYDKREPSPHLVTTLLLRGKGVCDAYSRAMWLMLNMLDIPCICIVGDAGGPHAWNLVYTGGQWYHVDATWDDPICYPEILSHGYFCISDREMWDTHRWNRRLYPPTQESKPIYYRQRGRYFRKIDEALWKSARDAYSRGDSSYEAYIANIGPRVKVVEQIERVGKSGDPPILDWSVAKGRKGVLHLTFASKQEKTTSTPPRERTLVLPEGGLPDSDWIRDLLREKGDWGMEDFDAATEALKEEVKKKSSEIMEKGAELWDDVKGMWP